MLDNQPEQVARLAGGPFVAGGLGKGCQGDRGKRLGKHVASLPHRLPLAGHLEEHPSVAVEAVAANELDSVPRKFEPLGAPLHGVVKRGQEPGEPALLPHALVRIENRTVAVQADEEPAMLRSRRG